VPTCGCSPGSARIAACAGTCPCEDRAPWGPRRSRPGPPRRAGSRSPGGPRARAPRAAFSRSAARWRSGPGIRGRRPGLARWPWRDGPGPPPARSTRGRARRHSPEGCAPAAAARPAGRSTPAWPVLAAGPSAPEAAARCPRPSGTRSPSRDEPPSLPRSVAGTNPGVQVPESAAVSRCPRRSPSRRETTVPRRGQRPGQPRRWPVFRCRSMAGFGCRPRSGPGPDVEALFIGTPGARDGESTAAELTVTGACTLAVTGT